MEEVRNQALHDLGPRIPEVSFDQFKTAVLPCVDNAKLEQVYDALKKDGELSDEGWMGFKFDKAKPQRVPVQGQAEQNGQGQDTPALDPVQEEGHHSTRQSVVTENELYKPLASKFNKVLEHTQEATGKPPLITFSSTPSKGLKSEDPHGGYIADINALLVDTTAVGDQAGKEQFECDIVMTGEFKKVVNDSDTDDNISKLVGNINHLMGSDPTRRFAYGLTIEHTDTRFWFCSRSHIFITEQLDLQKNVKDVIYFVMALGSASKEQLGFDPTVRRVQRGSGSKAETRYRFTINGIEYETLEAISIYKANFLLGRANRVFKVQRVVNDELIGPIFVLKDLWLPEGAKTELEIQEDVKANINKVHVVEGLDATDFEKHFVAIKHCEIVKVPSMTNPRVFVDDNSTNFLRGNDLSCARNKFVLKLITTRYSASPSLTDSQMSNSVGSLPSGHRAQTQDIRMLSREHYGNKAHHRIVMEDAGCPLQDVRNLRTVIACIGKASTGLSIMFSAGMVHRDISTGNLLVSEVDGELRCKITDLEYAKKVGASSQSPQDIKTVRRNTLFHGFGNMDGTLPLSSAGTNGLGLGLEVR
uniref:Fungal-type protein kinase domain-containing protein n=1 Tax=Moniliophthora roreri TaxID=221103 RepID=A0A0W0F630_MONRR